MTAAADKASDLNVSTGLAQDQDPVEVIITARGSGRLRVTLNDSVIFAGDVTGPPAPH